MSLSPSAVLGRVAVALVLAGGVGIVQAGEAPHAEAAVSCRYSDLSSTTVKNVSCNRGAYASLSRANSQPGVASASGTRQGAWATKGKWSKNTSGVCHAFPTMMWG